MTRINITSRTEGSVEESNSFSEFFGFEVTRTFQLRKEKVQAILELIEGKLYPEDLILLPAEVSHLDAYRNVSEADTPLNNAEREFHKELFVEEVRKNSRLKRDQILQLWLAHIRPAEAIAFRKKMEAGAASEKTETIQEEGK